MGELFVYEIGTDREGRYIRCGHCGEKSYDPGHIGTHYCPRCPRSHDKVMLRRRKMTPRELSQSTGRPLFVCTKKRCGFATVSRIEAGEHQHPMRYKLV